jgi:ABC-type transport system involved in cytochrome bd biosynthesis fused ATPase/permease subunit
VPGNPEDAPAGQARPVLSLRHAAKSFGAVRAVVDSSADLYRGEAHALLGENGAGKSTVVKLLAGVYPLDEGELLIDGAPVTLHSPAAARDAGIAVIYQEPTLFPDLTVAENIFMGRQPLRTARRIDRRPRALARRRPPPGGLNGSRGGAGRLVQTGRLFRPASAAGRRGMGRGSRRPHGPPPPWRCARRTPAGP